MMPAFAALRAAFRQMGLYFGLMIVTNVAAIVLVLPVVAIAVVLALIVGAGPVGVAVFVTILVGILPCPSTAGLQYVTHEAAFLNPVFWRDQIDGLRQHGLFALRIWLVAVLVSICLVANIVFYGHASFPGARLITIVWVLVLLVWLAIHLYVYPLLMEQEVKSLVVAYRNAALMSFARPLYTLTLAAVWWFILFTTILTGVGGIFGLSLSALIQQNAAAVILPSFRRVEESRGEPPAG